MSKYANKRSEYMSTYTRERRVVDREYDSSVKDSAKRHAAKKYAERKAAGLCVTCANSSPTVKCAECVGKANYVRPKEKAAKYAADARKKRAAFKIEWKQRLVDMHGGGCKDCGYNTHLQALEFDHLDGTDKKHDVARMLNASYSFEAIAAEAAKCELVCANCHRVRTAERRATKKMSA
jgi:hypothetical protein